MAREEGGRRDRRDRDENPEFQDRPVAINRVSKTVKVASASASARSSSSATRRAASATARQGPEVPEAIRKATEQAKRQMACRSARAARCTTT